MCQADHQVSRGRHLISMRLEARIDLMWLATDALGLVHVRERRRENGHGHGCGLGSGSESPSLSLSLRVVASTETS